MFVKTIRIFGIIIGSIILLNIILFVTFSIPSVQMRAANFALAQLQPKLGTELGLRSIRVRLFNSVELQGLYVGDKQQDTLLYVGRLTVQLSARDLLRNNVSLHRVRLENFTANVYRDSLDKPFNFQFVIDAFSNNQDTITEQTASPWHIVVNDLVLRNGTLRFRTFSEPETPEQFNANHLEVEGFNFRARADFRNPQDMSFDIMQLSLSERNSGLRLNDFNGRVIGMGNLLLSNVLNLSVNNSTFSFTNARFNTKTQEFSVAIDSDVTPQDISIFAPIFCHLDHPIALNIDVHGTLPEVSVSALRLTYGDGTSIHLSASVSDIREIESSSMSVNIKDLFVSQEDLEAFIRIGADDFYSPEVMQALGDVHLQLTAYGRMNNFRYDGTIEMYHGDVTLSGIGSFQNNFDLITFDGPVRVYYFRVKNIIGENIGVDNATVHLNAHVQIEQDKPVLITADGNVVSALYNGFRYENLRFTAQVNAGEPVGAVIEANINIDNELNEFDLNAELAFGNEMQFVINGMVYRLDLRPFVSIDEWQEPSLAAHIDVNMRGETLDNLVGTVVLDNVSLTDHNFFYNPGPMFLQAFENEGAGRRMQLMTSFLEATIEGDYYFTTIGNELMRVLYPHLPSIAFESGRYESEKNRNNFRFNVLLRNTEDLSFALRLPFYNTELSTITGTIDLANTQAISINSRLPRLMFGTNDIRGTNITLHSAPQSGVNLDINTYFLQERGHINTRLNSVAANDSIHHQLSFNLVNPTAVSNGELLVSMGFMRDFHNELVSTTRIHPTSVLFNGTSVDFNDATIVQRPNHIEVNNFGLREQDMLLLGIEGIASTEAADSLRIFFQNTELQNILAAFNVFNFAGAVNGAIQINQALYNPMLRTEDLRIDNITAHGDTIGTFFINGNWNNVNLGLDLDAFLINEGQRTMEIMGFVPTRDQSPYWMNVNLRIREFDLFTILPFATDIFSELSGSLSSNINITGSFAEPITEGWIGINNGMMRVAYTNVTYFFADTLQVNRDNLGFNNLVIRDQNNNTATLDVMLTHTNFGRMVYNANIVLNDFMLLNNERRTDLPAFGNLRLSGNMHVRGSSSGIFGDGTLRPSSRSSITVTIPQTATAEEYSGVVFVNVPHPEDSLAFLWRPDTERRNVFDTPIIMRVTLQLNQLLESGVVLNPVSGDALRRIRGDGELNFRYDSRATTPITLFGEYIIQEGDFQLNLHRSIDFRVREGSSLTMTGAPMNTQFNITAYHTTRADLATLHSSAFMNMSNTRVRANAVLEITGNMEQLQLEPTIEILDVPSEVQHQANSLLASNDMKMQQFLYLAAFGMFAPVDGGLFATGSNVAAHFAAGALSGIFDTMLGSVLGNNWRVGTILESQAGAFDNMRMGVDVSGRLLNNRLLISTNLSYADQRIAAQQAFMGEFEVEYELYSWLRLRAYNRANDQLYRRSPTTQGVGAVVTREARTFSDLFRFRRFGRRGGE